jgi:hypothetical protein
VSEINVAQPPLSAGCETVSGMGHLLGYARVSTTDQQPHLQVDALTAAGYRVFTETASGAHSDRRTLEQVLDQLRPGGTLVVWKLDRLGRSLRHLVDTVASLAYRGIGFPRLREAIDTTPAASWSSTCSPPWQGSLVVAEIPVGRQRSPKGSGSLVVEVLQELMGGELDLLVSPLGGPVLTSDQAHPMDTPKVPIDERVPGLGVVGRTRSEPQMPLGVVIPGVRRQEGVLLLGAGLHLAPLAVEHVLVRVDQPSGSRHRALIDRVGSHGRILVEPLPLFKRSPARSNPWPMRA